MTLGFHTALRAAKACSVRMRKVFLFLQSLFYICAVFKGVYILPSTPTHLFLPKITLHFLLCRCRDSQLSAWGCEIVGMEQKGGKTLAEMCMWEGRGVGGQGVFMEPRLEGPATCVAQKHFKLTTGERSVEWRLQRESLPATKNKPLSNRENDERKSDRSLAGRETVSLSLGGKLCNPIGFRDVARAYTMEEFSLLGAEVLFRLNNSFVPSLHPGCSNRHQNVCWFWFQQGRFCVRDPC